MEKCKKQQNCEYFCSTKEKEGLAVCAAKKGNKARFINHSCTPNCEMVERHFKGVQHVVVMIQNIVEIVPGGFNFMSTLCANMTAQMFY